MTLSSKATSDFSEIYLKKFGVSLSADEAERLALELLGFMKLIYRPILKKDYQVLPAHSPMYEL